MKFARGGAGWGGEGGGEGPLEKPLHHQAESSRPSIARRFSREHASQKYWRVPFSTEQVQVAGWESPAEMPQRAHT